MSATPMCICVTLHFGVHEMTGLNPEPTDISTSSVQIGGTVGVVGESEHPKAKVAPHREREQAGDRLTNLQTARLV